MLPESRESLVGPREVGRPSWKGWEETEGPPCSNSMSQAQIDKFQCKRSDLVTLPVDQKKLAALLVNRK